MLYLNLISKKVKQDIKLKRIYAILKRFGYILIIITALFAIIILFAKIILQNTFNQVVEQTTLITKNNQSSNKQIKEINTRLDNIEKIQNDFIPWSFLLEDLSQDISSNINFFSIKIDKDKQQIDLKGVAVTRKGLLDFKKSIEESDKFSNIYFPINNLLKENNINFEITAKLVISNK
ncbi:MAG: hypothetical protein V1768_01755 [Patescibacteria group bacterium]|nr:hypothetical protein [Patescibacteria group bacterium]MBU1778269.1 hypothetical protein [Patescibacteria group bacterium]MBU1987369.1 hypothetical protein [Patescibacteria group bacterium]